MRNEEPKVRVIYGWVKLFPSVIELSNPHTVAALLCRSWYWGHSAQDRIRMKKGLSEQYKPAALAYTKAMFEPEKRQLCVIFGLKGNPEGLRLRRLLFLNAQVYVEPAEWKKKKIELDPIFNEAVAKANDKLRTLLRTGAVK